MTEMESDLRGHLWVIVAVVATFLVTANAGRVGSHLWMDAHFDAKRMPVEAVNYLKKQDVKGPVLSPDYWGGYLIYQLPLTRVAVDDRHDLYGEDFLKSYLKMIRGERGWDAFLREHEISCVLLPREGALASILVESREWKQLYGDEVAIVLTRNPVNRQHAGNRSAK